MPIIQQSFLGSLPVLWAIVVGCDSSGGVQDVAHAKPATVEKLPNEVDLATVTLSADAVRRLGIETELVQRQRASPRRTLGGEAMIPAGNSLVVAAPMAALVFRPEGTPIPLPGARVAQGDPVLTLVPLLSPERDVPTPAEQVQLVGARANLVAVQEVARGEIERSRAEVEGAQIALQRAEKLFADRAGTRRAVDDAIAQLNISESVLKAATQRESQLAEMGRLLEAGSSPGEAAALPLCASIGGIVNRLNVNEGQTVASGAILFELVNLDVLWIRVPVFVDFLPSIQHDQNARIVPLTGNSFDAFGEARRDDSTPPIDARPIVAPPTADALTSTADLYYEIDNRSLGLRPGQRVGVELPLVGADEALAISEASIVLDIYGNAWVYVVSGERQYTRRRISIRWVENKRAILASGPDVGNQVVVAGAAELFGTEFGAGK